MGLFFSRNTYDYVQESMFSIMASSIYTEKNEAANGTLFEVHSKYAHFYMR